ncbi:MAG: nucleoside 2-deoxyribosyltransferase [Candidatus Bathyarchaeota archaeon]|nr:nucleoside 2-deoxyribosyltransferase [Candidatus Bathyarchaeota archaeon]
MKKTVFISGPIQGMETNQDYRKKIARICERVNCETIDPWLREKIIYRKDEPCWWNNVPAPDFVERDLADIEKCDVLIAYLPQLSAGTCMELFHAKRKGKKVIVISDMKCLSPWIVVHADKIVKHFDELEDSLKQVL